METAGIWVSDTVDDDGDLKMSLTCPNHDLAYSWLDAEDRAALIEHLQRFPLPQTGTGG